MTAPESPVRPADRGATILVADALKTDPATRDIPVVVHSVIDNPRRAEQLGADGVLVKPAQADALRALLRRILAREGDRAPT
jgi:CheY-like chemotaxis protein